MYQQHFAQSSHRILGQVLLNECVPHPDILAKYAAGRFTRMRAIPISNRSDLLAQTAAQVHIRATGHGWCLAEEKGCGGAGLYEAARCGDCKNSAIDQSFLDTRQGIYAQQEELLAIADVGPAVQQRAARELEIASQVMRELGVTPVTKAL